MFKLTVVLVGLLFIGGCAAQNFKLSGAVELGELRPELPNIQMKGKDGATIETTNMDDTQYEGKSSSTSTVSSSSGRPARD
jgi:hypothetical protein